MECVLVLTYSTRRYTLYIRVISPFIVNQLQSNLMSSWSVNIETPNKIEYFGWSTRAVENIRSITNLVCTKHLKGVFQISVRRMSWCLIEANPHIQNFLIINKLLTVFPHAFCEFVPSSIVHEFIWYLQYSFNSIIHVELRTYVNTLRWYKCIIIIVFEICLHIFVVFVCFLFIASFLCQHMSLL